MNDYSNDANIICFYHENEAYGCFSNWYQAPFSYAGRTYSSVEQYMMYQKVVMFRGYDVGDRIMVTHDPAEIKKLGRSRIERFDSFIWDKTSYAIVKRGVRAKFAQNSELLDVLLSSGNKLLAEAAPKDLKWGIGKGIDDPERYMIKTWTGKNYLGRILMEVRDELRIARKHDALGYVSAEDIDFPEWHMSPGELYQIPKYHATIKAYADTLDGVWERDCFYHQGGLHLWEESMRYNMGGGLPAVGFWEMKQDIFDIARMGNTK